MNKISLVLVIVAALSIYSPMADASGELLEARGLLMHREEKALERAKEILEVHLSNHPNHVQALCLLAEVHLFYGDLVKQDGKKEWETAQRYAKEALNLDPNSAEGHYLIAAAMGRIGEAQGILKSLFAVSPMLDHLETALELDPDHAWSHYVLSQLYYQLPSGPLMKGDKQLALEYARRAWELDPSESEFSMLYARQLIENKQTVDAKDVLTQALKSPTTMWTRSLRDEAEQILRGL